MTCVVYCVRHWGCEYGLYDAKGMHSRLLHSASSVPLILHSVCPIKLQANQEPLGGRSNNATSQNVR